MIPGALRAEWGKTWSLRSSGACLAVAVALVVATTWTLANDFTYGLRHGDGQSKQTMRAVDAVAPALQFALLAFTAFVMIGVTSEYSGTTVRTTLRAVPRRWPMLAAKTAVSASVAAVAGGAAVAVGNVLANAVLEGHVASGPSVLVTATRATSIIALDAVLVAGLAAVIRSSVGTLVASTLLLVGTLALPERVTAWAPGGAAGALLTGDPDRYPAGIGALVLGGWAVGGAVAGVLALRRDA